MYKRLVSAFDNKFLRPPAGPRDLYLNLGKRLGRNFTRFVDFVLARAEEKGCGGGGLGDGGCALDVHWRPYYARLYGSARNPCITRSYIQ